MQGQMYSLSLETAAALGSIGDLFELKAATNVPLLVHSIRLGQFTLEKDAQAEMAGVRLASQTTPGTGGSTAEIAHPTLPGQEASDSTHMFNATADAAGTQKIHIEDSWNVQAGWLYLPTPEERIWIAPGAGLVIFNKEIVATATITLTIFFEEFKLV